MKNPRRPLEPHETSYLLLARIRPDLLPRPAEPSVRPTSRMGLHVYHCACAAGVMPGRMVLHTCEPASLIR